MIGLDILNQHECSQSDTPHRGDILFYGQNQKMESLNSIDQILPSIEKIYYLVVPIRSITNLTMYHDKKINYSRTSLIRTSKLSVYILEVCETER